MLLHIGVELRGSVKRNNTRTKDSKMKTLRRRICPWFLMLLLDLLFFHTTTLTCFYSGSEAVKLAKSGKKKQKVKENQHLEDQHLTFLHDTASSPVFDFSTDNFTRGIQQTSVGSVVDNSQGFINLFYGKIVFPRRTLRFLTIRK